MNNSVDEILPARKLSATNHEAPEFLDSNYDAKYLFQVNKICLEETKKILTDVSVRLNTKRKFIWG